MRRNLFARTYPDECKKIWNQIFAAVLSRDNIHNRRMHGKAIIVQR